jgi:hypothetical protein
MKTTFQIKKIFTGITILILAVFVTSLLNKSYAQPKDFFKVNVKLVIEGFYDNSKDEMNCSDYITLTLRDAMPPYNVIDEAIEKFDSKTFTGNFSFKTVPEGKFYLQIRHRNSIEIWSKAGGEIVPEDYILNYDFSDSKSKTFGECLNGNGKTFCLYSGDVNQDGVIDASDFSVVYNDICSCVEEGYYASDLTGDNYVDAADWVAIEKYIGKTVYKVTPETGLRPAVVINTDQSLNFKKPVLKNTDNNIKLNQNYPNPFNPSTKISFVLKNASNVNVTVFDVSGRAVSQLINGYMNAGKHEVTWNAENYSSGTYIYILRSEGNVEKKIMHLIK